ncbi:MAG: lipoyl(octanoyl) transferase LipB [Flavobacteriales bacterium]|nr:lipoyl(octanoyl) transferase LipB [Flavobacteriales bacterium]
MEFGATWKVQEDLFNKAIDLKIAARKGETTELPENHFLYVEHPHVFTLGKSGDEENLLLSDEELSKAGATYFKINRGGDITYHGPGQIVGYPILDLDQFFTDIHKYLRYLEEAIIRMLSNWGIEAGRIDGLTGVWVGVGSSNPRKIAAMGVKCSRWVTMHGFALNANTDLGYFDMIVPCGISDKGVTSMQQEIGNAVDLSLVKKQLNKELSLLFDAQMIAD